MEEMKGKNTNGAEKGENKNREAKIEQNWNKN